MGKFAVVILSLFVAIGIFFSPAHAEEKKKVQPRQQPKAAAPRHFVGRPGHGEVGRRAGRAERHDFRGHDFRHFSIRERGLWIGGAWYQGVVNGVFGWYWCVGGMYYPFALPVYPYPLIVPRVAFEVPIVLGQPEPVVVQEQPVIIERQPPPMRVPAPPRYRYRCDDPPGYPPEIEHCLGKWHTEILEQVAPPPPPQ